MSPSRASTTGRSSRAAYTRRAGGCVSADALRRPARTRTDDDRSSPRRRPVGSTAGESGHESRTRRSRGSCVSAVRVLVCLVMVAGVLALSADRSVAGQPDRGSQLAAVCASCHRLDGRDHGIASIIGLDAATLVAKMTAFKSGEPVSQIMRVMSLSLTPEDLTAVARYLSAQRKDTNPQ